MNNPALIALLQNAALLLALVVVFDLITSRRRLPGRIIRQILAGLIVSGLCIGVMLASFRLETGIIFDTRSVMLATSGLFLGAVPTSIAMVMAAAFRVWLGGAGAIMGVSVIFATGLIGILWRHVRKRKLEEISAWELYAFGVVVHLVMLALMLTLPAHAVWRVLSAVGPPVLLVYPVATAVLGFLLVNRFQREHTIAALAMSEERSRLALHAAHMGTYEWDRMTDRLNWSHGHEQLWGFQPGEFDGTFAAFAGRLHPEDLPGVKAAIDRCAASGERFEREFRVVWPDGGSHWISAVGEFTFVDGRAVRMHGVVLETTARRQAQQALAESEARFRGLFRESPIAIIIHDKDTGAIVDANAAAWTIYGYRSLEELQSNAFWTDPPYAFDDGLVRIHKAASEGTQNFAWKLRRASGEAFWAQVFLSYLTIDDIGRVLATIFDITDRKQAEEKIVGQLQELQRWQGVILDREARVIELKRTINDLLVQAGQPPRYLSVTGDQDADRFTGAAGSDRRQP